MLKILVVMTLFSSLLIGEDCQETCEDRCPVRCHRHCRRPPTPEEEYLWHERASSEWPGKRDDNLIDQFLHQ